MSLGRTLALLAAAAALASGSATYAGAQPAHPAAAPACRAGYYRNVDGHCVHRPERSAKAPAGASARCRDGTYSFSQHASGTCSHHGGVARWIHHP